MRHFPKAVRSEWTGEVGVGRWEGGSEREGSRGIPGTSSLGFLRVGSESEEHANHQAQNHDVELKRQVMKAVPRDADSCRDGW